MMNQTKIPKLSDAVLETLSEADQRSYHRLWDNSIAQQEELKTKQRFFDRIFPEKKVDRVMVKTNYLCLMGMKYAMEAQTDFERNFVLPEAYQFLCNLSLGTYYHVDHMKPNKSED